MTETNPPEDMTAEPVTPEIEALMAGVRAEVERRRDDPRADDDEIGELVGGTAGEVVDLAHKAELWTEERLGVSEAARREEQARRRELRGLGLRVNIPEPALPADQKARLQAEGGAAAAFADSAAEELNPEEARERLGMPEEVFAQAWQAFYRATTTFPKDGGTAIYGMAAIEDPGPIAYLATPDGRPYLAVLREPWEVLELTEDAPYGAALTAAATTAGAMIARFLEWGLAGLPESFGGELAKASKDAAKARGALLEELRRLYRPSLPPLKAPARGALAGIANAFPQGIGTIPSSKPIQAALAAISNAQEGSKAWQKDPAGLPFYAYGEVGITYSTSPPDEADLQLSERVWDQLRHLDDTAGDVLLAAMAQWMLERDADGDTHITAAKILDYRGIKPRRVRESAISARGGHRPEDLAKIAAAFEHLDHLWLDLSSVEVLEDAGAGKKPRRRRSLTLQSKLISVSDRISQTEIDLTGARPRGATPIAWTYRPGKSLTPFLEKPNLQTALLLQKALEYDPYRHVWEKRLARYFTIHLRIGTSYGPAVRRKVGPLLEELSLAVDTRNPERTKQRFEVAMARLAEDGVIGPWRPIVEPLPARKWLPAWLNSVVTVTAPAALSDHYAALANKAATKRNRAQRLSGKS